MSTMSSVSKKTTDTPRLRLSGFDGPWKLSKISDFVETIGGLTYSPSDISNQGMLVLRSSNVQNSRIDLVDTVYVNVDVEEEKRTRIGDIVLCVRNGSQRLIGKSAIVKSDLGNATHGAFMSVLRGEETAFIFQLLQSDEFFRKVRKNLGATINSINGADLRKFKFYVPTDKDERRKLSDFLSAVDAKITQLEKKSALLESYKKGCVRQIFSRTLRMKDSDGVSFPDWQRIKLGDVVERVRRKNQVNDQNVLTISAQDGLVSQTEYFNHSVAAKDTSGYYRLLKGEFAYNKSYSNGYPLGAIKRLRRYPSGVVSTLYICFSASDPEVSDFLEWYFESQILNRELARITQEGARNHGLLNMAIEDFFALPVLLPTKKERILIVQFLNALEQRIELARTELSFAKSFKQGLLQQMFV